MKRIYHLPGLLYSDNKKSIKEVFKKNGLKWTGTKEKPIWSSSSQSIELQTQRKYGMTVHADLIYIGPGNTGLTKELTSYLEELGGTFTDEDVSQSEIDMDELIEIEIATWDLMNKPNEDALRRPSAYSPDGAPEAFIEASMKDYQQKRLKKVLEIRKKLEKEHGLEVKEDNNRSLMERFG